MASKIFFFLHKNAFPESFVYSIFFSAATSGATASAAEKKVSTRIVVVDGGGGGGSGKRKVLPDDAQEKDFELIVRCFSMQDFSPHEAQTTRSTYV